MRIGLSTPMVAQVPGAHSSWERLAGVDDLVSVATAADELGYDHLTCPEHVAVPAAAEPHHGATFWDPLATLSYLAAHTHEVRLATSVVVLGYHHPVALAKRYGTLDLLSGGRVILGVGVGSLPEEFALLGADWEGRDAHADDALRALRAALGRREPTYEGTHHAFGDLVVAPHALGPLPLWVGGRSARSLRRAVELGDGWMPSGMDASSLGRLLAATETPETFELVLGPGTLDPLGDADGTLRRLQRLHDLGATVATCGVRASSTTHCIDQLARLRELADRIPDRAPAPVPPLPPAAPSAPSLPAPR